MEDKTLSATVGTEQTPYTTGQKAVGITFNPGGDSVVNEIKQKFAEIIDIIEREKHIDTKEGYLTSTIYGEAIRTAMDAQMWAIKHVTWKL